MRSGRNALIALLLAVAGQFVTASAQIPRFLSAVTYPAPGASSAALADINGDGLLDVVTANGFSYKGSGVSLLLGGSKGAFKAASTIVADGNPSSIVVADFNNDGKLDVAVGNEPDPNLPPPVGGPPVDAVSVLLGNGDGTFQTSVDTTTLGARFMAAADFNGDGKLDLAITGNDGPVQILLGNADGTFTVTSTSTDGLTSSVFTGDFNHDGKQDLLAGGFELLGNGDGTFTTGQSLPVFPVQNMADFNGDGIPDLTEVFHSVHNTTGLIAFGLPDGTWAPSFISNFSSDQNLVSGDFDGDGKQDLFGPGAPPMGINQPVGGLFLGNGDGFFTLAVTGFGFTIDGADGVGFPAFTVSGDLDRNGSPDLVIAVGTGIQVSLDTFGAPPLLAQITTSAAFVVGGSSGTTGTVSLGGPAPSGGAVVTLTSNNPAVTFPSGNTLAIPAGSQTASFGISTLPVTKSTPVTISSTYNSVRQSTVLMVVPPVTLSSVSVTPSSLIGLYGGAPATGTVALGSPAPDGTVIALTSSSPTVASVPASVAVTPGATSATFTVTAFNVASDTATTITAAYQGTTRSAELTVRKKTSTVTVTKAEYTVKKSSLLVEATSTDRVSTLQVFNSITGQLAGSIPLVGVGKFSGQLFVTGTFTSTAVQSSVGGVAIATVKQK